MLAPDSKTGSRLDFSGLPRNSSAKTHPESMDGLEFGMGGIPRAHDDNMATAIQPTYEKKTPIATNETRRVRQVRGTVFFVLLIATAAVSAVMYLTNNAAETRRFLDDYEDHSMDIQVALHDNIRNSVSGLDNVGITIRSSTQQSQGFVNIADWPSRSASTVHISGAAALAVIPVVSADQRDQWERFALNSTNNQWIVDTEEYNDYTISKSNGHLYHQHTNESQEMYNGIYQYKGSEVVPQDRKTGGNMPFNSKNTEGQMQHVQPNTYMPIWMHSPLQRAVVNLDALSTTLFSSAAAYAFSMHQIVIGRPVLLKDNNEDPLSVYECIGKDGPECDQPASAITLPIFKDVEDRHSTHGVDPVEPNKSVAAIASLVFYWRDMLQATNLSPSAEGIYCILHNECGDMSTFLVDHLGLIKHVGDGDLHEHGHNHFRKSVTMGQLLGIEKGREDIHLHHKKAPYVYAKDLNVNNEFCPFTIETYPSPMMEARYRTHTPFWYTFLVVSVFFFTSCVFLAYDCMSERRHFSVMRTAVKTGKIVNSLFPEQVRSRLFDEDEDMRSASESHASECDTDGEVIGDRGRLRSFTSAIHRRRTNSHTTASGVSKPIADKFMQTTVLFSDIAGFTQWSSSRDPEAVFILLETLYAAFDALALRCKVFKIETIGDCYVAVTGLPEPQKDHAIRMTRFADQCMKSMHSLSCKLCESLGDDTSDLSIRTGLHSGAVTAGVLRGQKSRFQLFGDTVNTAARMESNGSPGRIHCSEATAELLIGSGKGCWLIPRDNLIVAKGKGEMKTFWIDPGRTGDDEKENRETGVDGQQEIRGKIVV